MTTSSSSQISMVAIVDVGFHNAHIVFAELLLVGLGSLGMCCTVFIPIVGVLAITTFQQLAA